MVESLELLMATANCQLLMSLRFYILKLWIRLLSPDEIVNWIVVVPHLLTEHVSLASIIWAHSVTFIGWGERELKVCTKGTKSGNWPTLRDNVLSSLVWPLRKWPSLAQKGFSLSWKSPSNIWSIDWWAERKRCPSVCTVCCCTNRHAQFVDKPICWNSLLLFALPLCCLYFSWRREEALRRVLAGHWPLCKQFQLFVELEAQEEIS